MRHLSTCWPFRPRHRPIRTSAPSAAASCSSPICHSTAVCSNIPFAKLRWGVAKPSENRLQMDLFRLWALCNWALCNWALCNSPRLSKCGKLQSHRQLERECRLLFSRDHRLLQAPSAERMSAAYYREPVPDRHSRGPKLRAFLFRSAIGCLSSNSVGKVDHSWISRSRRQLAGLCPKACLKSRHKWA